jgi:histidine triad (HIT) family protein
MRKENTEQLKIFGAGSDTCKFCRIIRREVQSYVVFEDDVSFAFLDHRPLIPGHSLLVPREHYKTLIDLPTALITPLFTNARLLAQAVEEGLQAEGSFVAINNRVSQSVPHLHIHIVPRRRGDGLKGFFWPRQTYKDEDSILKVQEDIRSAISRIQSKL